MDQMTVTGMQTFVAKAKSMLWPFLQYPLYCQKKRQDLLQLKTSSIIPIKIFLRLFPHLIWSSDPCGANFDKFCDPWHFLGKISEIATFWTPGLPGGVLVITYVSPSVSMSMYQSVIVFFKNHSKDFSIILNECKIP